jgi:hypothetical protein
MGLIGAGRAMVKRLTIILLLLAIQLAIPFSASAECDTAEPLLITGLSFGQIGGDVLPVSFTVTSSTEDAYRYDVFAVVTDGAGNTVGERLIASGHADTGAAVSLSLSLRELFDYDSYRLRLDASFQCGTGEIRSSAIAPGSFAVSGRALGEAIPEFRTEVDLTSGLLLIDWSRTELSGDYLVAVFGSDDLVEPFFFDEITDDRTSIEVLFDPDVGSLRVEITLRVSGRLSPTQARTIPVTDNGTIIRAGAANRFVSSLVFLEYDVREPLTAEIIVNGNSNFTDLAGRGRVSVGLQEAQSEVEVRYRLSDPLDVFIVRFPFSIDMTPPLLRLPEHRAVISVDAPDFVIAGVTEPGATLHIAGVAVPVGEDGTFIHIVELEFGENMIRVTSADRAGNVASQDVVIIRLSNLPTGPEVIEGTWDAVIRYLPLIFSFTVATGVLITVLVISRGYEKAEDRRLYVLGAIRTLSILLGVFMFCGIGYFSWQYATLRTLSVSDELFAIARESVDVAYSLLSEVELHVRLVIYFTVAFGILALTIVVANLLINAIKNPRQYPPPVLPEDRRHSFMSSEITYQIPAELAFDKKEKSDEAAPDK